MRVQSLFAAICVLVAVPLFGQSSIGDSWTVDNIPVPEPRWGTTTAVTYVIGSLEFVPYVATSLPLTGISGGQRGGGTAGAAYDAAAHLPTGARVIGIEILGCDNSVTSQIQAAIYECLVSGTCLSMGQVVSGTAQTGCGHYANVALTPFTVNNYGRNYAVEVNLGSPTGNTFAGIRLYYHLQVSPGPATATFVDVPASHPFYDYIEALKAAGITGGCVASPPQYCPDQPVTRGQMAVFLARALGLHFPF